MNTKYILLLLISMTVLNVFGQEKTKYKIFSIGLGLVNENNVSNFGIYYSNDLKIELLNRLYLNPRVGFFQSTGTLENGSTYVYRSHSGLFLDCGLSYSFIKKQDFEVSFNLGPSYQIGNDTFTRSARFQGNELVDATYENNRLRRLGGYADLEFSWHMKDVVNTIGIKSNVFGIYPEYIGIIYKIGLKK